MESNKQEMIFRHLALQYANAYGASLRNEQAQLERQNIQFFTPRMDASVAALKKKTTRKVWRQMLPAIAAGVVLLVAIPVLLSRFELSLPEFGASGAASEAAPAASIAPEGAPPDPGTAPSGELLPITFALPYNLSVSASKLDNGKSVYFLSDTMDDDVVMTMQQQPMTGSDHRGLKQIDIDGTTAYVADKPDYKLITFESDGVLYTLTCQHDVNTILALAQNIIEQ